MANNQEAINQLFQRLELLSKRQEAFKYEIFELKNRITQLQATTLQQQSNTETPQQAPTEKADPVKDVNASWDTVSKTPVNQYQKSQNQQQQPDRNWNPAATQQQSPYQKPFQQPKSKSPLRKSNLEKFIGENLLNKIGILILVIGIAIGAKYSIENDLISPLTRIILGYVAAIGLLGFGIKLKKKYESYSAVLVSGAIVVLYFITFFAYSFYDLIEQTFAFVLMVLFTGFTVVAALNYNKQIIAHLGLVGAYAVPFLLSNDSGRVEILFSYMAIINIGILIIAFKKYWKLLFYSAFVLTWLIFTSWFIMDYTDDTHFTIGLSFLVAFYFIFYLTFLAYKLVKKEAFAFTDIILVMANSFVFYGLGYAILGMNETAKDYLGLFTLGNAIIHFMVAAIIYKQKLSDKNLFYLTTALVLTFITIAIPVQLDGNWVTLLWTVMAALLFWLGTSKEIPVYEKLSYPLMGLAFLSLLQDWDLNYKLSYYMESGDMTPLWNVIFLTSLLFVAVLGFVVYLQRRTDFKSSFKSTSILYNLAIYVIPIVFLLSLYLSFRLEIELYWNQLFSASEVDLPDPTGYDSSTNDYSLNDFKSIWVFNYTLFFVGVLGFLNFKRIKNKVLEIGTLVVTVLTILVFLLIGLYNLSELREAYLEPSEIYNRGSFYLIVRYVSYTFLAFAMTTLYRFIKKKGIHKAFKIAYDVFLHLTIVWVVSSELIHWLDIAGAKDAYKLGLSILWGVYSFLLIGFGIWKNKPYLRIGGMALFAITLIKLFFYDLTNLNTISKTIVFVSLGILLLIISFLYNKYKNKINYNDNTVEETIEENENTDHTENNSSIVDEFDDRNDI